MGLKLVVFILWIACLASALAVVENAHRCRMLTADIELAKNRQNKLQEEWGQYLLEYSALGALQRVESIATAQFAMVNPELEGVKMVVREKE